MSRTTTAAIASTVIGATIATTVADAIKARRSHEQANREIADILATFKRVDATLANLVAELPAYFRTTHLDVAQIRQAIQTTIETLEKPQTNAHPSAYSLDYLRKKTSEVVDVIHTVRAIKQDMWPELLRQYKEDLARQNDLQKQAYTVPSEPPSAQVVELLRLLDFVQDAVRIGIERRFWPHIPELINEWQALLDKLEECLASTQAS